MRRITAMLAVMGLCGAAQAGPIDYALDAQDSLLYISVFKDPSTLAAGLSHDHAVRAAAWSGEARIDPGDLSSCEIDVRVPVSGLVVDEPWMRRVAGLEGELPEAMKDSVRKNMLSADQLSADEHPDIRFSATHCTATGIQGELTLRGVTQTIDMPARLVATSQGLTLTGQVTIKATDYGFQPFSAMMGALRNQDEMSLSVTLIGSADAAVDAQ